MKRGLHFVAVSALAAALALTASAAEAAVYNFEIESTTAMNANGDVIRVSGAGQFSEPSGPVRGTGHFTHYDSTGAVVGRGIWRATDFIHFESEGSLNNGFQFGRLDMLVTFFYVGGTSVENVLMTVDCEPGEIQPPEGTEITIPGIPPFNVVTGGFTLFNLQRGR